MRRKPAMLAAAIALGLAPVALGPVSHATGSTPESVTAPCSTWQYLIKREAAVHKTPGGEIKFWVKPADTEYNYYLANITIRDGGVWYYGNFYKRSPDNETWWVGIGWVLADRLENTGKCW